MPQEKAPEGQLFTHVYCDRSATLKDSKNFRRRIGTFCGDLTSGSNSPLGDWLRQETGLEVSRKIGFYKIEKFFLDIKIEYLLNSITLVWRFLKHDINVANNEIMRSRKAGEWHSFIKRALSEENMGYRLDDKCGVHYLIDEEFERNKISTIRILQAPKYSTVLAAFEDAHRHLDSVPLDTKAAVRSLFEMVDTQNLNSWIVKNRLKEIALKTSETDQTAQIVVDNLFNGFARMGRWNAQLQAWSRRS